ncbi:MAG: hypothetical protein ABI199_05450 [Bacteroidia bacterium]
MKKVTAIFFCLFYLLSTSGVVWNNFYCCGKLKQITFFSSTKSTACKSVKKLPGCCQNKTFFAKVKDNHPPSSELKVKKTTDVIHAYFVPLSILSVKAETFSFTRLYPPPLHCNQPVYIAECNFRV